MLATQMVATHTRAMDCLHRATLPEQTFVAGKRAAKFLNLNRARSDKHRGKGQRKCAGLRARPCNLRIWRCMRPGCGRAKNPPRHRPPAVPQKRAPKMGGGHRRTFTAKQTSPRAAPGPAMPCRAAAANGKRRCMVGSGAPRSTAKCPETGAKHARGHRPQITRSRPWFERRNPCPRKYASICSKLSDITTFSC